MTRPDAADPGESLPWRKLVPTVLIPNLFYGCGQGALLPVIPLFAVELGGTVSTAALVAASMTVGQFLGALPAGYFVDNFGERWGMLLAGVLIAVASVMCVLATSIVLLSVAVVLIGLAAAFFAIARHAWITVAMPKGQWGRALSSMAGANRLGLFVGPFLSAGVIGATGEVRAAFGILGTTSVLILLTVGLSGPDGAPATSAQPGDEALSTVLTTFRDRKDVLVKLGFGAAVIGTMRAFRWILVPLWGVTLGMDAAHIAVIAGIGAAVDFSLFYAGGTILDRFGLLWVAVPMLCTFAAAYFLLASVETLPHPTVWYVAIMVLMSMGNGVSSGVVAVMGSGLADPRNPAVFLSAWRLVSDFGPAAAPLGLSAITATYSLSTGTVVAGVLSLTGAASLRRYVPRFLGHLHH